MGEQRRVMPSAGEKLLQYSAVFISVTALAISIWSAIQTRTHDRLSLRPGVNYYWHTSIADPEGVGIFLENSGSGPAQISGTKIYLDLKMVSEWQQITDLTRDFYNKGSEPSWTKLKQGYILGSGRKIPLYYVKQDKINDWDGFVELIRNRVFAISEVCSMYADCYYVCSNADDQYCSEKEAAMMRK